MDLFHHLFCLTGFGFSHPNPDKNVKMEGNMRNIIMLDGDRMLIKITDDLDHHITKELKDHIDEMVDRGVVKNIAFDLSATGFMDSAGIGLIMGRYKKINPLGGEITVVGTNPAIERIIRISGIHKIIRMEISE